MGARLRISDSGGLASPAMAEALRSPSRPLDPAARSFMEDRLGIDLGAVRLHTGSQAAAAARRMDAEAYTIGNHIVFGGGRYDASSPRGRFLLAHELAHVVQQAGDGSFGQPRVQRRAAGSNSPPTLRFGARGVLVEELQRRLNEAGASPVLAIDGVFGPLTHDAVVAVQRANGLVQDGIVGPKTWGVLGAEAPGVTSEAAREIGTEPAKVESLADEEPSGEGLSGAAAAGKATGASGAAAGMATGVDCDRERDNCYGFCLKRHLWRFPPDFTGWLDCRRNFCDACYSECLKSGRFPCIFPP